MKYKKRKKQKKINYLLTRGISSDITTPMKFLLSIPQKIIDEIKVEATRLDRPVAWVIRRAWEIAREHIRNIRND